VLSLSWGNRSGLIAAGGGDNSLRVFGSSTPDDDTDDEKTKPGGFREVGAVAKAHKDDVNCVAWHPTTPGVLASCADDGSVKIWNVVSEASTQRKRTEIPFGPGFEGVR
jgi:WD40 repeat protein